MTIRSEEVNYLVYRYLQESGFEHTSFTFAYESMIADTKVYDEHIQPGALITLLQKAMQYTELEAHVRDDGTEVECVAPFSLLHPHKCVSRKRELTPEMELEEESVSKEILPSKVKSLEGHTQPVYSCSWCPDSNLLATGSADSTIHLWNINPTDVNGNTSVETEQGPILSHAISTESNNDITCIDWSKDGSCLVTASYGGEVKLWSKMGTFLSDVCNQQHPIFNVSFSPNGHRLLVTGALPSLYVYSIEEGMANLEIDSLGINALEKQFNGCQELNTNTVILNSIWRDDQFFTYVDNLNRIVNVNLSPTNGRKTLQILSGHEGEISSFDWTKDSRVLVSGGDDGVIRLWKEDKNTAIFDYLSHVAEINQVLTSTTSDTTFFSCSNDKTIKIFDVNEASPIYTYSDHDAPVVHIAQSHGNFSKILASASLDKYIYFYDTTSNEMIRSCKANSHVYDMSFNSTGDVLSLATVDPQVYLIDLRV